MVAGGGGGAREVAEAATVGDAKGAGTMAAGEVGMKGRKI